MGTSYGILGREWDEPGVGAATTAERENDVGVRRRALKCQVEEN
jgi:hypothetical protein